MRAVKLDRELKKKPKNRYKTQKSRRLTRSSMPFTVALFPSHSIALEPGLERYDRTTERGREASSSCNEEEGL